MNNISHNTTFEHGFCTALGQKVMLKTISTQQKGGQGASKAAERSDTRCESSWRCKKHDCRYHAKHTAGADKSYLETPGE
jgi:hypothetical protein